MAILTESETLVIFFIYCELKGLTSFLPNANCLTTLLQPQRLCSGELDGHNEINDEGEGFERWRSWLHPVVRVVKVPARIVCNLIEIVRKFVTALNRSCASS